MYGEEQAPTREDESRARVVAAARRCFARSGVRKTRMAAVADEAGMARQTLYAFVDSRAHLLELAMAARVQELAPVVQERARSGGDLREDLAELLCVMIELTRADPEASELAAAMTPQSSMELMTAPDSELHRPARAVLEPLYERGVREGVVREGVRLDEMVWWARNLMAPLTARRTSPGELRETLRRFAVPAFLKDP